METVVREQGFIAVRKDVLLESRKPTTILSGLVTGPASKRDRSVLERLLKFECDRVGITGRLEFHSSSLIQKSGNLLLRIVVDDDAKGELSRLDNELRIGASGKVKFLDEREEKKSNPEWKRRRLAELEQKIAEGKQLIKEMAEEGQKLCETLEDNPPSVGSLGMSGLDMAEPMEEVHSGEKRQDDEEKE